MILTIQGCKKERRKENIINETAWLTFFRYFAQPNALTFFV